MKIHLVTIATALAVTPLCIAESHAASYLVFAEANINIRSGPGTRYPAVGFLATGREMKVHGCLKRYTWCDVSTRMLRGWVLASNIHVIRGGRRIYLSTEQVDFDVPIVTYNLRSYWDDYYRDRDFYGEIDDWSHGGSATEPVFESSDDGAPTIEGTPPDSYSEFGSTHE